MSGTAAAQALPLPRFVAYDTDGSPLAGGSIWTYAPRTTTPKPSYQNADATILNSNPITLDSAGSCLLYGEGSYTLAVTAADGSIIGAYSGIVFDTGTVTPTTAVNVLYATDYGVSATNADNSTGLQNFLNACFSTSTRGVLPPGNISFATGLIINATALTALYGNRVTIEGQGQGNTCLMYTATTGIALTYNGSTISSGIEGIFEFSDFSIQGTALANSTIGLSLNTFAHAAFRNMTLQYFGTGISMHDVLSSYLQGVVLTFNNDGLAASYNGFSDPNAISFYSCEIGNNNRSGVTLNNPATVNFFGGAIETNGYAGSASQRWGVLINNGSTGNDQGNVGANFYGVYFEGNANLADVWITEGGAPGPQNIGFYGCSFSKISTTIFTTNSIRLDLAGTNASRTKLTVVGCGFASFNGYAPNAGRPNIGVNSGGATLYEIALFGNMFNDTLEAPNTTNLPGPQFIRPAASVAWVSFNGTTGAIFNSYNISAVTRTAAGTYSATFQQALAAGSFPCVGTVNGAGFFEYSLATTGVGIVTTNAAGTATDFNQVSMVVYGPTGN